MSPTRILIGLGLVIAGLMAGILLMLFRQPESMPQQIEPRIVERVQLGAPPAADPGAESPEVEEEGLPGILSLNNYFKNVAEQVTPAVVFIQVEGRTRGEITGEWYHGDRESQRRFFRDRFPRQSVGSGVIVSTQGHVVTNHHVIQGAERIRITLADKRQYDASVLGIDMSTDLAVLKIEEEGEYPAIRFGNSDDLEVGEWVLAVGNPFRLTSTVTAGIISALGRQVNIIEDDFRIEDFIQTDAAINPGNSGGALVDLKGNLIGINTAIATESGSYEGYGFAVPVNLMERVVTDLIAFGTVERGFLGVSIQEVDARVADRIGLARIGGVYVNEVRRDGAAHMAGVRDGDVVLSVGGRAVNAPNELQSAVARFRPGENVHMEIWRAGSLLSMDVQLLGRDAPAYERWFAELNRDNSAPVMPDLQFDFPGSETVTLEEYGFGIRSLTERDHQAFEVASGVYIAYVQNGTPADAGGLPRDAVIVDIDGEQVYSTEDVLRLLELASEAQEPALINVKRRSGLHGFYEVTSRMSE